jgi:alpha-D-ribose 1-methylphosphonate 5-triphosphate synthase subunit PhnG
MPLTTETRAELLAAAAPEELTELAERLIAAGLEGLSVVKPPKTGLVMMQVREPVAEERFFLGEVLVTEATVDLDGALGWSMREGDDRVTVLAAAVLDAVAVAAHPAAAEVEALCSRVSTRREAAHAAEWDEIAPTIVEFEDLP